jgi:hypothetical protein
MGQSGGGGKYDPVAPNIALVVIILFMAGMVGVGVYRAKTESAPPPKKYRVTFGPAGEGRKTWTARGGVEKWWFKDVVEFTDDETGQRVFINGGPILVEEVKP